MKTIPSFIVLTILLLFLALAPDTRAQVLTILHTFGDNSVPNDGETPLGTLVLGTDGNFYGTTESGGSSGSGAIFKMTPTGAVTIIHSSSSANDPTSFSGSLIKGLDGNFYGVAQGGGSAGQGCIFSVTPGGTVSTVHSFGDGSVTNDGLTPTGSLLQASDGNFYGTTASGGSASDGIIYKVTPQGTFTVLHNFGDGSVTHDGTIPRAGLIQGGDGNFYGMTSQGGTAFAGIAFRMTPLGSVTVLHNFEDGSVPVDAIAPTVSFIQGTDGNFYGTSTSASNGDGGLVFKMTPQGTVTLLHNFGDRSVVADGANPESPVIEGSDGNFYGTAYINGVDNAGCVYELTPQGQYTILHSFKDGTVSNDGVNPRAGLVQGPNGLLYGMTQAGGLPNLGTIFSLAPAKIMVTSASTAAGSVSLPFSFQVTSTRSPTTFAATNLPNGLSINSTSGLIAGTPTTVGVNAVNVTFTNASDSGSFPLSITIGALPVPVVTSIPNSYGTSGAAFIYDTTASNLATSYAATGLDGTGLSIDSTTGIISGTPSAAGNISATLTATNATGTSASFPLSIQILAAPPMLSDEYSILHRFGDGTLTNDGISPLSILQAFDGNLYGATYQGGVNNVGAIYKIGTNGVATLFYSFDSSTGVSNPTSLLQAANGDFYGTTDESQVFRLTQTGQLSVVHDFPNAFVNPLIQGFDGNFYGTLKTSGPASEGQIYQLKSDGTVTILHNFGDGSVTRDGSLPVSALTQGTDGNFYGTTPSGGMGNEGTVFKLTPQGLLTILHSFSDGNPFPDGSDPNTSLIQGSDGNFYGTTTFSENGSGNFGDGTIFKISPDGVFTILHFFSDGSVPNDGTTPQDALVQGFDGNFYGESAGGGTAGDGAVYQITPQGTVTIIHSFNDGSVTNDSRPFSATCALIQSYAGNFYGVNDRGGTPGAGDGALFSIDAMQTPTHVPIYVGSAYQISAVDAPFSFTPRAEFGASGSGVEIGSLVKPRMDGGGIEGALGSLLPQAIIKFFSANNWTLTGTLPNFLSFDMTSGTISGTPVQAGIFTVTMTPHNSVGDGMPMTVTLYIDVPPGFSSPVTVNAPIAMPFSYQITTSPPADAYSATGLPGWLAADPVSGIISGTPPAAGSYVFNAVATNVSGQSVQPVTLTVTGGPSGVPAITSPTTASDPVGSPFTYQISTSPGATSFSALTLPSGLLFDSTSGSITGTPSLSGVFQIPLSAVNAAGSFSAVLSLTITQPMPPRITSPLSATVAENANFSYQITASGGATSFTATGYPAGFQFDSATGMLSGSSTATGTFPISLSVTNSVGTTTATLNLHVIVPIDFGDWENGYGITGNPTDIPKGDGLPNLLKYLYDLDPTKVAGPADRAALPVSATTTVGDNTYLTLTYRQYAVETGIGVHVQKSSNLQNWITVSPPDLSQQIGIDPVTGDPIMQVGVLSTGSKQFIRLDVTSP